MRTKIVSFSASDNLIRDMQELAKEEDRTLSELIRECFRRYRATRDLQKLSAKGKKLTKARGLRPKDFGYDVE